jgi:hypothetical protein
VADVADVAETESGSADRADVGVLFVHGIGEQQQAETLLRFAEPLRTWVDARSRVLGGGGVTVEDRDSLTATDQPAHTRWEVVFPGGETRWLLAEARWADAFPPPSAGSMLIWAASFSKRAVGRVVSHLLLPGAATFEASSRGMGAVADIAEESITSARVGAASGIALFQVAGWILFAAVMVFCYLWIPLLAYAHALAVVGVLVVVVAWVAALILVVCLKLPVVKSRVARFCGALVTSVGDTYALIREPISAGGMRGRIRDRLAWIAERCDRLVVVAHSQGAALTADILTSHARPHVDWLVTVGGAVGLLDDIQTSPWRRGPAPVQPCAGRTSGLAGTPCPPGRWSTRARVPASAGRRSTPARSPRLRPRPPSSPSMSTRSPLRRRTPRAPCSRALPQAWARPTGTWPSRSSRRCPAQWSCRLNVPDRPGRRRSRSTTAPRCCSTTLDIPTTTRRCWARIAEIVATVLGRGPAWSPPEDAERRAAAERGHVTAVRLLGAARLVNALAALCIAAVLVTAGLDGPVFSTLLSAIEALNEDAGRWLGHLEGGGLRDALRLTVIALVGFWVLHGLTAAVWRSWRRSRIGVAAGLPGSRFPAAAAVFAVLLLLSLAACAVTMLASAAAAPEEDAVDGALIVSGTLFAAVAWCWGGIRPKPTRERIPVAASDPRALDASAAPERL